MKLRLRASAAAGWAVACAAWAAPARADEAPLLLVLRGHRFEPSRIEAPAGRKLELRIRNEDATADEFDSPDLHREKDLPPGQEVSVYIGPLRAGSYEFTGELHSDTAHGVVVAK